MNNNNLSTQPQRMSSIGYSRSVFNIGFYRSVYALPEIIKIKIIQQL